MGSGVGGADNAEESRGGMAEEKKESDIYQEAAMSKQGPKTGREWRQRWRVRKERGEGRADKRENNGAEPEGRAKLDRGHKANARLLDPLSIPNGKTNPKKVKTPWREKEVGRSSGGVEKVGGEMGVA